MWCSALNIFTSTCAWRHNAVHVFNISISKSAPNLFVFNTFDFEMCFAPQRRALFHHLNPQKRSEAEVFYLLTWKCASRRNAVHFFDIANSKSVPKPRCFVHVVFEMCFAPQRRALFRHLSFQKWSDPLVFLTF